MQALSTFNPSVASDEKEANTKKAKKVFRAALDMDPENVDAAMGLVDLHCSNGDYKECIDLLLKSMRNQNQVLE